MVGVAVSANVVTCCSRTFIMVSSVAPKVDACSVALEISTGAPSPSFSELSLIVANGK